MADAPSASDVANIVVFVVPGFFARLGYLARFPQRRQEPAYALIISIAASVPLVALANSVADFLALEAEPLNAAYGLLLVTLGLVVGYLTAVLRGWSTVRSVLQVIGIPFDPEATVFERTLLGLPETQRSRWPSTTVRWSVAIQLSAQALLRPVSARALPDLAALVELRQRGLDRGWRWSSTWTKCGPSRCPATSRPKLGRLTRWPRPDSCPPHARQHS